MFDILQKLINEHILNTSVEVSLHILNK